MLLLVPLLLVTAAVVTLRSDADVARERQRHDQLFIMLHSPHDHGCTMALPMFRKAANGWSGPGNVTFALVDVELAPKLAKTAHADVGSLPAYVLSLAGLAKPIRYQGGWSDASISTWLRQQSALQPTEVRSVDDLLGFSRDAMPSLLVVGFLNAAQRERRLLEVAARAAQAHASIALGDDALAAELGAETPCVIVVRLGAANWPLLRGPTLSQRSVEDFVRQRALPLVVAIGDSDNTFSMQVRAHPINLQVLLIHRSGKSAASHEASEAALREMRDAAASFEGRALFLSYDFFDNDPETFTSYKVYASELPAVLVVHGRGGFEERTWRLPGGGERLDITARAIEGIVSHALDETGAGEQALATASPTEVSSASLAAPPGFEEEDDQVAMQATVGAHGELDDDDVDDFDDDEEEEDGEEKWM